MSNKDTPAISMPNDTLIGITIPITRDRNIRRAIIVMNIGKLK